MSLEIEVVDVWLTGEYVDVTDKWSVLGVELKFRKQEHGDE